MKHFKFYLTIALLLMSVHSIAQPLYQNRKISADSAWTKLGMIRNSVVGDFFSFQEGYLKYLQEGLKFWKMFPDDPRRYQWLQWTVGSGKFFCCWLIKDEDKNSLIKNILHAEKFSPITRYKWPINKTFLEEWETLYPQLKKDFISYYAKNPQLNQRGDFNSSPELELLIGELATFLNMSLNTSYLQDSKIDLFKLLNLFTATAPYLKNQKIDKPTMLQKDLFGVMNRAIIGRYKEYGLNVADVVGFLDVVKKNNSPILKNWAIQQGNLFTLMEESFVLKCTSIEGHTVDLSNMKGKVILVDFWSVWCSSCIARMPFIKSIYDKYKNQGFEVISACANNEDKLEEVKKIEKKIGASWPIIMLGYGPGTLGQGIFQKYGFWGVPQYLLLNRQGKVVMINDKLRSGNFEPIIKQLLAEKYNSN